MARSLIVAVAGSMIIGASASACGGGTDAEPSPEQTSETTSTPVDSDHPEPTDPLKAQPAEEMLDLADAVVRADDGTAVVVTTNEYQTRTTYRVYDSGWKPLTPALALRGSLVIDRGLADGFVATLSASREKGRPRVHERVTLDSDGTLTTVDDRAGRSSRPVEPRPGDRRLTSVGSGRLLYRPDSRTVHRTTVPEWDHLSRSWYVTAAGDICALERSDRLGSTIHVSVDEGRTFADLSTAVLPADSGPRVQSCETAGDRVVVMTGGEYPQWLHVLDRTSGDLLASHDVGDRHGPYDPYGWRLLPDGKLVIDTNRPGLYVATDSTNTTLEFRPRPRVDYGFTVVVGDDLALLSGGRRMYVSPDEGRSWIEVEL